jgi:GT2 family glycosyltransferase
MSIMKQSEPASIAVIAVNYQTDSLAVRFVKEIAAMTGGPTLRVILVDNTERADSNELFDLVLAENPTVRCIKPPTNLGYFRGAWYGLEQCMRPKHVFDWVIVSNVDLSFPDKEIFAMLGSMRQDKDIGVVAPSIRSDITFHDQNPFMPKRPSRARMRFYRVLHRSYCLISLYEALAAGYHLIRSSIKFCLNWRPTDPRGMLSQAPAASDPQGRGQVPIYAPHGACMIFSSEFFTRGGSLEVPFFLYGEEIYVAETARALGLKVVYNPGLRVQHREHQSTRARGVFISREAARYVRETTDYLVDAYFS